MSSPTSNPTAQPGVGPRFGLILKSAGHLVPLFQDLAGDRPAACKMALSALAAYHPEGRADYIDIARIIAFSNAAVALLTRAESTPMTMAEQMRAYGRANALNRSAEQTERAMMRRRAGIRANPPQPLPAWMDPTSEPIDAEIDADTNAETDAEINAHLAQIDDVIAEALRTHAETKQPPPVTPHQDEPAIPKSPQAITPPNRGPVAVPVQPPAAIRATPIPSGPAQPRDLLAARTPKYRDSLLQNSALPRMADPPVRQHAG